MSIDLDITFDCFSPLCVRSRRDLFGRLEDIPLLDFSVWDNEAFSNLLLFDDEKLNMVSNRMILEATISFMDKNEATPLIFSAY